MWGIFILNPLIIIIEPLATAQPCSPNITDLLEGLYQYIQQRTINYSEKYGYSHSEYYEGVL